LKIFKSNIHIPGKLASDLLQTETELQNKVATRQAEEQRAAAQAALIRDQESKALEIAGGKFASCIHGYQFEEGMAAIVNTQVTDPGINVRKVALLKKAQWLVQFKDTLVNDINVLGYTQPIVEINGASIAGGVHKATKAQLEIDTQYGALIVPWGELPPSEIMVMADYFTKKTTVPGAVADRMWLAGVFGVETGLVKNGKALLDKAATIKADYYYEMILFPK